VRAILTLRAAAQDSSAGLGARNGRFRISEAFRWTKPNDGFRSSATQTSPVSGMLLDVTRWLCVDVGGRRKGFDIALVDDRRLLEIQGRLDCAADLPVDEIVKVADTVVVREDPAPAATPG
jgi:hypothetical protein